MKLLEEKEYKASYSCSLEEFIQNVINNSSRYAYKSKVIFVGSSECRIDLEREYSFFYHNSFRPDISFTVTGTGDSLEVTCRSRIAAWLKVLIVVLACCAVYEMISMFFNLLSDQKGLQRSLFVILFPLVPLAVILPILHLERNRIIHNILPEMGRLDLKEDPS